VVVATFDTNRSNHGDSIRSLAIALAIALPIAAAATAKPSAVSMGGMSIEAAVPAVTKDVRYRARRGHPTYNSYWRNPAYSSHWGYPTYYHRGCSHGW
jgi:hypothetical protein